MSEARLTREAPGRLRLSGPVDTVTVPALLRESRRTFDEAGDRIEIDLGGVTRMDSAGVALLLDWQRRATATLNYRNPPAQMRAIVDFCGLEDILKIDRVEEESARRPAPSAQQDTT